MCLRCYPHASRGVLCPSVHRLMLAEQKALTHIVAALSQ